MNITERATNTAKSCILPLLTVKIGDQYVGKENFAEFQPILRNNLQTLLDIFHANQHELLTNDLDTLQFRKHFILLLCEQSTEYDTVFQTSDLFIKETLKNLCHNQVQKVCRDDDKLLQNLFEYYHKSLNKDNWKYSIGAVNGFLTFARNLYGNAASQTNMSLDYDRAQFILATGLNFLDNFEPNIQIIGIKLFNVLLNKSNSHITSELNMEQVILDDTEKLIQKSNEIDFVSELWQCLHACCLLGTDKYIPDKWSKFDDIFEGLIQRLSQENDKDLSMLYLSYVIKFSVMGESKFDKFDEFLDINSLKEHIQTARIETDYDESNKWNLLKVIQTYRQLPPFVNVRIFRWIKKLLILLQNEAFKLGGNELAVSAHVNELHIFYSVTIFTVPTQILRRDFVNYCTKLIATLLETYQIFKHDPFICQCVTDFLITIQVHLNRVNHTELDPKVAPLVQKLYLQNDDKDVQEDRNKILEEIKESEKALTMILEKMEK